MAPVRRDSVARLLESARAAACSQTRAVAEWAGQQLAGAAVTPAGAAVVKKARMEEEVGSHYNCVVPSNSVDTVVTFQTSVMECTTDKDGPDYLFDFQWIYIYNQNYCYRWKMAERCSTA